MKLVIYSNQMKEAIGENIIYISLLKQEFDKIERSLSVCFIGTEETEEQVKLVHDLLHSGGRAV